MMFLLHCLLWRNYIFPASLAFSFVDKQATWSPEVNSISYLQAV